MDTLKNIAIGLVVGLVVACVAYFYMKNQVNVAYQNGLADCSKDIDTVIVHGEPIYIYRDTSFTARAPVNEVKGNGLDSTFSFETPFDTTWAFGKDSIKTESKARITIHIKKGKKGENKPVVDKFADWFQKIEYKKFVQQPDTIKIYTPKYITVVEKENNWLFNLIALVLGLIGGFAL